eukprot:GCRY01001805.1.p1 GENE.GCRY01001805.1~~GCRY01001805.1.p1  ORF type:complete len:355 (-),score=78.74 GCRY01001805.1:522-1586(-)
MLISLKRAAFLAGMMLICGSINTICIKLENTLDLDVPAGIDDSFVHPVLQTWFMFIGEFSCLLAHAFASRSSSTESPKVLTFGQRSMLFLVPCLGDLIGTSLMMAGLVFTYASVYQMLRGSLVIVTALLSYFVLKRDLHLHHLVGVILVVLGTIVVGGSSVMNNDGSAKNPLLGVILILAAQLFVGVQFAVEEQYVVQHNIPPLQAVGLEGMWGVLLLGLALPLIAFIPGMERTDHAFIQIGHNWKLLAAVLAGLFAMPPFNFFGITVSREMSCSHRAVIDSCRTIVVWAFSLLVGWETFQFAQLGGFFLLILGSFFYNEVIRIPHSKYDQVIESETCPLWKEDDQLQDVDLQY